MAQGLSKTTKKAPTNSKPKSHSAAKFTQKVKVTRLGNPLQLPKGKFRDVAVENRVLSKAIHKSNEQKVAAKLLQAGGKISMSDIKSKGKELAKEIRRDQVKRKLSKIEEKINELEKEENNS